MVGSCHYRLFRTVSCPLSSGSHKPLATPEKKDDTTMSSKGSGSGARKGHSGFLVINSVNGQTQRQIVGVGGKVALFRQVAIRVFGEIVL